MIDEETSLHSAASHSAALSYQTSSAGIYAARTFVITNAMVTNYQQVSRYRGANKNAHTKSCTKNTAIPSIRSVMPLRQALPNG